MWRILTLSLVVTLALGTEVSPSQEVMKSSDTSSVLGKTRRQILTAQFACYLKIIHNPPWSEEANGNRNVIQSICRRPGDQDFMMLCTGPHGICGLPSGHYCNRTWDGWLCWEDSAPGTEMQMCPGYFNNFDPGEKVTKVCNPDGQWFHHPQTNRLWSNYTHCDAYTKDKLKLALIVYYLAMVGNGLSIVSLIICVIIFSYFKSLSCQRISLHKNMFLSFILNSIVTIMWLTLTVVNTETSFANNPVNCKILSVLMQYTSTSIYFWMLCEGTYLHTRIVVAVFVGEQKLFWYYILGWGFPVIPAIAYAVSRRLFFNDNRKPKPRSRCTSSSLKDDISMIVVLTEETATWLKMATSLFLCWISTHTNLLYIIHIPIQAALLVNFFFLLNIVRVLITKLKVTHRAESTVYLKAVRATLILVSLLGVQHILIPWRPEGRISRIIYDFFYHIYAHFQGLLVAIILCFCNAEAQTALRRKWAQWKSAWGKTGWGRTPVTGNHFNYHNSSITETSRATVNQDPPVSTTAVSAAAACPQHNELSQSMCLVQQKNNGQDMSANDYSNKLETTYI